MSNARNSVSRIEAWVSITEVRFGAKADAGVTDSTSAIQAALNTGKDVFIPSAANDTDYYKITAALTFVRNGQRIFGEGERSKIRQVTALANVITATSKTGVVVESLKAYAVGSFSSYDTGAGIAFFSSSRCKAINCIVENHRGAGVLVYNSNDCTIRGNHFINSPVVALALDSTVFADIAVVYSSSRNTVMGNFCRSGQGTGIQLQSITGTDQVCENVVTGNVVQDAKVYGILAYRNEDSVSPTQDVRRNVISGNTVRNVTGTIESTTVPGTYPYGAGIYIQGAEESVVTGNSVKSTHSGAVTFSELLAAGAIGTTNVNRVSITGNTIDTAGMYGISMNDPNGFGASTGQAVVSGNIISNTTKCAINTSNRGRLSIVGNTVDTTGLSGIRINNTVSQKPDILIAANQVRNTTGNGGIEANFCAGVSITGNQTDTGTVTGILVGNCSDVSVKNNTVRDHTTRGIQITSTCTVVSVTGNNIAGTGTSTEGMRLDASTHYADNYITGCTTPYASTFAPFRDLTANSTTPSVADGAHFKTANTNPTTITNFSGGVDAQEITVVVNDANTTLDFSSSNLKGNAGVDRAMASGDAVRAVYRAGGVGVWYVSVIAAS
jgi:parallel beta-helix repeat protein